MLDPGKKMSQKKNPIQFSIDINRLDDRYGAVNYKNRAPKSYQSWNNLTDFGVERRLIQEFNEDSGICSPPLWKTSPPRSPNRSNNNHYRNFSSSSRTQAIANGQKELMEMVSKMPEGCYELSLKDIVEINQSNNEQISFNNRDESFSKERSSNVSNEDHLPVLKKKNEKKVQIKRSGSIDHNNNGGFLLKMVFPVSWKTRNKKNIKKNSNSFKNGSRLGKNDANSSGRVSPRPLLGDGSVDKNGENEWWKNRFVEKEESDQSGGFSSCTNSGSSKSSRSSSSRSSSRNSSGRQVGKGCLSFLFMKRGHKSE